MIQIQPMFSRPRSLVDQVRRDLRDAIVKGVLHPGQQIKELELQQLFGVSRAPIREALRVLEAEGLIAVDDHKKRIVRQLTQKDLSEILPVLASLEGLAASLAAPILQKATIRELDDLNDGIRKAFQQQDYVLCSELNFRFHSTYIKAAGNKALARAIKNVSRGAMNLWLTNIYYRDGTLIEQSVTEHRGIIGAFKKKDADLSERRARYHLDKVYQGLLTRAKFDDAGQFILESHADHG